MFKFLLPILILSYQSVLSQIIPNNSPLSIKEIMKGNEFVGNLPESIRWSADGQTIFFEWNPQNELGNSTYAYLVTGKTNLTAKADSKSIFEFELAQRNNLINYYSIEGALVAYDKKTKVSKLIYQSSSPIYNIQRTKLENIICFQQENNLYSYNAFQGTIVQLTNFQSGEEKPSKKDDSFVSKEEADLFQFLQDKKERKDWRKEQETTIYKFPKSYYFGDDAIENIQISPDNRFVGFRLSAYPKEKETHVENHISSDGHTFASPARAKVSDEDPSHRLGIYSIEQDSVFILDFSKLSDIRKKPSYLNDASLYEKDRKIVMHSLKFSTANNFAVCDIRAYDNKDRWIVLIDLVTKEVFEIEHQHDEAWIGGPGISSWNAEEGTLGWLNDGQTVYFQSEESGYSHLYTYSIKLKEKHQLTSGKWEVHQAQLSNDGKYFYITGNRNHPGNREFWKLEIASKKLIPILTSDGAHEVSISPDEKTLAIRYSYKNQPWELFTAPNIPNTQLKKITNSTTAAFNAYQWRKPQVTTFKASDGLDVYARIYEPIVKDKNKAAVIFVHGAGYLQNAHNYWSNYYREYMFHNLLVDNGFTVLDIDYRASEGYGRDYRTAIYRHMGGRDLQDHLDGKDFLVNNFGIDSNRIGIYGGSYGGFISLMAMLTTPTEFPCAAALRSVTDWAHYNHEYTSNILNYPGTDPEAYKKSSPIYYANQLQGKLLMLHGMVDDNVQFQDVVRLSQRFIELGKENWELAVFPVEAHGFKESYSWNDEYRRIYELFYTELILKNAK